jgi:hypothetical protein
MRKSLRKRSPKRKVKKSKNRKRINDGTNDPIGLEDVTLIMPTKAEEFSRLWTEVSGKVFFDSLTLKINDKLVNFMYKEVGRTHTSINGERTLAYHFTDESTIHELYKNHKIFFFKAADVVDFKK